MTSTLHIDAGAEHASAIRAVSELFDALRLQKAFVGTVALSAWLGKRIDEGSVDVLAMLSPERMRQVPMMAGNRGFSVDPKQVERAEELDLIPLKYDQVRIHVLMATNALYGKMLAGGVEAQLGDHSIRVVAAEDLALLLLMAEDREALDQLIASRTELDLELLNRKLVSIGLSGRTVRR